jgi:hypothetical protein
MLKSCVDDRVEEIRQPLLNNVDFIVIEMARKDGPLSFSPKSFWARVSRYVLGIPVPRQLANDTLEALRRFSVRAWYWDVIRTRDVQMLIDAGYSHAQAMEVLAQVAARRGFSPTVEESSA